LRGNRRHGTRAVRVARGPVFHLAGTGICSPPSIKKYPQEPRDGFTANAFIGTLGPLDRRPSGEAGLEGWPWRQIARDMVQPHCVADLKEIEAAQECK